MNKIMNKNIHNFHFVLDNELKEKIVKFSEELNLSVSDSIIFIIDKTLCVLKKYQFDIDENEKITNYQNVNWNVDTHVYLDKNLYRKIKHLAGTKFAFSIAIIIRKLLELYFYYLELSSNKIKRVERIFRRFYSFYVKKYIEIKKKWNINIKDEQLFGEFYYKLTFNEKFTLTGINFNNSN